jgi:predicted RNA binding protein YcfA (HicA-like mRNA interferase family)
MPKLPRISGKQAIKAFEKLGFVLKRQKGSHVVLRKEGSLGSVGCVIPLHRDLALGTLRAALRQSKVTDIEFLAVL